MSVLALPMMPSSSVDAAPCIAFMYAEVCKSSAVVSPVKSESPFNSSSSGTTLIVLLVLVAFEVEVVLVVPVVFEVGCPLPPAKGSSSSEEVVSSVKSGPPFNNSFSDTAS